MLRWRSSDFLRAAQFLTASAATGAIRTPLSGVDFHSLLLPASLRAWFAALWWAGHPLRVLGPVSAALSTTLLINSFLLLSRCLSPKSKLPGL